MGRKNYQTLILLVFVGWAACKKDEPNPAINSLPGASGNCYILCEGNLGSYQACLYAYNQRQDSVFGDLYKAANLQTLGDILQSMQHIGDKLLLSVNNSDKIVVLSASDWKQVAEIKVRKPRYILPVSSTKAYVSSEYNNKVYVVDLKNYLVTDTISLPYINTEGMCINDGYAFICCWDIKCNSLYKIDVGTNKIVQTIALPGYAPQEVLLDKEQLLWVLSGNQPNGCDARLTKIDPSSGSVIGTLPFASNADPLKPVFNATRDTLYFLEAYNKGKQINGVYRLGIHESTIPEKAFIEQQTNQYFWALGINPTDNNIYVADAKDFNQKSTVYIYDVAGSQQRSFNAGPGAGHFYFDQ